MVRGTLYRHRVRGVSHHRHHPGPGPRAPSAHRGQTTVDIPPNSQPCPPLTPRAVAELLGDLHQGLLAHSVSEAVEQASVWRQVSRRLQDLSPGGQGAPPDPAWVEAYTQYRATWRLWEHRLAMLTYIAQAQRTGAPPGQNR